MKYITKSLKVSIRNTLLYFSVMLLASCVDMTKRADTRTVANPAGAYLYGRFHLEVKRSWTTWGMCPSKIILGIKHLQSGKVFRIALKPRKPVYAIKIVPGWYKYEFINYYLGGGQLHRSNKPSRSITFRARSGAAAYVGDYLGWVSCKGKSMGYSRSGIRFGWGIKSFRYNIQSYAKTSAEFRSQYPRFSSSIRLMPISK